ncbi:MAG: hypothetical protein KJ588_03265 [Gammaproteobacteria bacterium]|nr:hypothetical protein [Gammaproteobacteria bacterium]
MFESLKKDRYLRWFLITLITVFIVKSILASVFPLTGDEAYYVIWGEILSVGILRSHAVYWMVVVAFCPSQYR